MEEAKTCGRASRQCKEEMQKPHAAQSKQPCRRLPILLVALEEMRDVGLQLQAGADLLLEMIELRSETTMHDLLESYPGAQRALFRKYHIGGCASCGFQPSETIAQVCARNGGLSVEEVIHHLHTSLEEDKKMQISPEELAAQLREDPSAKVVDVRTREEHEAARIEGSILLTQELMQEMLAKWDHQALTVFYDHKGTRSMDAAAYFAGHGFSKARSLRGGVDAWSEEVDSSVPRYHLE
jgi:rhodanese-related sulfurtransferase